jgi:hypothetical protein
MYEIGLMEGHRVLQRLYTAVILQRTTRKMLIVLWELFFQGGIFVFGFRIR